jgi:2,4-dienoyl-CoA reductase-like NADH-dependent reductase (Old Yellow Enzyme family)
MSTLFETTTINNLTLENRFVRSATWEGMANRDGSCTPELISLMVQLARGGVGLIITGHSYIRKEGQAGPWQLGVYRDELIQGLTKMTEAVHKADGKIIMQLAHAGCMAPSELSGMEPFGPSVMENQKGPCCQEMTQTDISVVIDAFAHGAVRAKNAGFDGVQIHAAHGYLLSQFLSPFFNKRTDGYGGSIENRTRIVLQVLRHIRTSVGNDFPVLIKINSEDFLDGGLTIDDMLHAAALLEKAGIDAIELSGGTVISGRLIPAITVKIDTKEKEVFYKEAAKRCKKKISVPLMLVGGIRSYEIAEQLINNSIADYISLCRPLICEPYLIDRWKQGDTRKARCLSDSLCFKPAREGRGLYCVREKGLKEEY